MTVRPSTSKPRPGEWVKRGNCRDMDVALFYPEENAPIPKAAYDACADCPVRAECLNYALTPPMERWGLWGGLGHKARVDYLKAKKAGQERLELEGVA